VYDVGEMGAEAVEATGGGLMRIKVTIDVCEPGDQVESATLILDGALVASVRLGQWIEQTKARLCKKVLRQSDKKGEP